MTLRDLTKRLKIIAYDILYVVSCMEKNRDLSNKTVRTLVVIDKNGDKRVYKEY